MAEIEEDDGALELEQSTQHLKDFKLAIEFKYLVSRPNEARTSLLKVAFTDFKHCSLLSDEACTWWSLFDATA